MRYLSILFLNTFTLLPYFSVDKLFHLFIVLGENKYCLISSLHCSFTNATLCPLFCCCSSFFKHTSLNIFITIIYLEKLVFNYFFISSSLVLLNHILLGVYHKQGLTVQESV